MGIALKTLDKKHEDVGIESLDKKPADEDDIERRYLMVHMLNSVTSIDNDGNQEAVGKVLALAAVDPYFKEAALEAGSLQTVAFMNNDRSLWDLLDSPDSVTCRMTLTGLARPDLIEFENT